MFGLATFGVVSATTRLRFANPTRESMLQGVNCNAASCQATAQAISDAIRHCPGQYRFRLRLGQLSKRTQSRPRPPLRSAQCQTNKDDDDRWYAFDFHKPSGPKPPKVPANLTAVAGAASTKTVIADWDDARRADKLPFPRRA